MGESMENQEIDEESYNGSYKTTKKNDSSHQWKATCKILLQSLSLTQFHQTFVSMFLNHKMFQIIIIIIIIFFFFFKFWFWGWLPISSWLLICVFLNHKMLQIFFIWFYFVGPHIEQRWRCFESFTFITLKSSSLFWGARRGRAFQLSKNL